MSSEGHPGRPAAPESPCAGFALVDMLVALMLLALLAGLMAAFTGQFRTIQRLQATTSAQMELDGVVSYLGDTIGSAMSLPFVDNQAEDRVAFEGSATRLRFVTIARQGARSFGLRETLISVSGEGNARKLIQQFSPRRADKQQYDFATTSVELAADVSGLRFQYLGYDTVTHAAIWSGSWTARDGLPAAVRIDLQAKRGGATLSATGQAIITMSGGAPTVARPVGEL